MIQKSLNSSSRRWSFSFIFSISSVCCITQDLSAQGHKHIASSTIPLSVLLMSSCPSSDASSNYIGCHHNHTLDIFAPSLSMNNTGEENKPAMSLQRQLRYSLCRLQKHSGKTPAMPEALISKLLLFQIYDHCFRAPGKAIARVHWHSVFNCLVFLPFMSKQIRSDSSVFPLPQLRR